MPFSTRTFKVGNKPNSIAWWRETVENFDYLKGQNASTHDGRIQLENDLAISSTNIYGVGLRINSTGSTGLIGISRATSTLAGTATVTIDGYMSTAGSTADASRGLVDYDRVSLDLGVSNFTSSNSVVTREETARLLWTKTATTDEDVLGATVFSGTTSDLNDFQFATTFAGATHSPYLRVTVSTATATINPVEGSTVTSTVQTFDWDYRDLDGNLIAAGATGLQMQTATSLATTLAHGLKAVFGSAVGHTTGTYWQAQLNAVDQYKLNVETNYTASTAISITGPMRVSSSGMVVFSTAATFAVTAVSTAEGGNVPSWDGLPWQAPLHTNSSCVLQSKNGTTGYYESTNALALPSTGTYLVQAAGHFEGASSGDFDITWELVLQGATTADAFSQLHTRVAGGVNKLSVFPDEIPLYINYLHNHTSTALSSNLNIAQSIVQRNPASTATHTTFFKLMAERLV